MTASAKRIETMKESHQLGDFLLGAGFVEKSDLEKAFKKQEKEGGTLGHVLADMHVIEQDELDAALSVKESLSSTEKLIEVAAGSRGYIGELLMQTGRINSEQLSPILEEQDKSDEPLGELLMKHGYINNHELHSLLAYQSAQANAVNNDSPLKLGNLMRTTGKLTSDELNAAVTRQQQTHQKLGDVLVDMGYAKPKEISRGLSIQRHLVSATLSALLCVGFMVESPSAHAADVSVAVSAGAVVSGSNVATKIDSESLYRQGIAYQEGKGVKCDMDKAVNLLTKAAESGHIEAQYVLGVLTEDTDKSMFWLNEAASRGHEQASFAYAQLANFDYGVGC